jgi:DNA-binding SARP family transcriptional activator
MSAESWRVERSDEGLEQPHRLCLLGGPYVQLEASRLTIPEGSKRLLVFVALHGGRVDRRHAAGMLWPDGDDERASGNLRSALWRLKGAGIEVLEADKFALSLRPGTDVDVDLLCAWTDRVIDGTATAADLRVTPHTLEAIDLLPGWYDDWVIFERERLRQRLLHALEALSRRLRELKRWSEAVEVAMTAVSMEPLRESAQLVLAEAHFAEGNLIEVVRCFRTYQALLDLELGVTPGQRLTQLLDLACRSAARKVPVPPAAGPDLLTTARPARLLTASALTPATARSDVRGRPGSS